MSMKKTSTTINRPSNEFLIKHKSSIFPKLSIIVFR